MTVRQFDSCSGTGVRIGFEQREPQHSELFKHDLLDSSVSVTSASISSPDEYLDTACNELQHSKWIHLIVQHVALRSTIKKSRYIRLENMIKSKIGVARECNSRREKRESPTQRTPASPSSGPN